MGKSPLGAPSQWPTVLNMTLSDHPLYVFTRVVITEFHRLDSLNDKHSLSPRSGGWSQR